MRTTAAKGLLLFLLGIGLSGTFLGMGIENEPRPAGHAGATDTLRSYTETVPGTLTKFEMVPVPAGSVTIDGTKRAVGPFWMARTEARWPGFDTYRLGKQMEKLEEAEADAISLPSKPYGFGSEIPGFGQEEYPVLSVTRHAAQQYARWLSAMTEHTYRLPTAAEWKYACQLGHGSPRTWSADKLARYAWFQENANGNAHPAASLDSNGLGLYDVLGNAAEHVAPPNGQSKQPPEVWGGSYQSERQNVHCSAYKQKTPAWQASDPQLPKSQWWLSDAQFAGFRLVRRIGD